MQLQGYDIYITVMMEYKTKTLIVVKYLFRFNVSEFSRGNIMGYHTGAELGAKDTFYLGRFAHTEDKNEVAIKWLEEAALQAAADGGQEVQETQVNLKWKY